MERWAQSEDIEACVAQLDEQLLGVLADSEDTTSESTYVARLGDGHTMEVRVITRSASLAPKEMGGYGNRAFIFREDDERELPLNPESYDDMSEHRCNRHVIFSFLHEKDDEETFAHGLDYGIPLELTSMVLDDPQEFALLSLVNFLSKAIQPNADGFRFDEYALQNSGLPIGDFLTLTSKLAARGAHSNGSFLGHEDESESSVLWATYHDIDGDVRHLSQAVIEEPYLSFSVETEGIEYVYERSLTGRIDVKTRIADEAIRYAELKSMDIEYEEDGTPISWSYSLLEVEALEAEERAMGLYEPSVQNLQMFLDAIPRLRDAQR